MTLVKELPPCNCRYGRTEIIEAEDGKKKTARIIICCGYREVDPKECIDKCTGFPNSKLEFNVVSFMKLSKDLRFRSYKNSNN
jgi:hypothetical protein